jgi:hypothetical protein
MQGPFRTPEALAAALVAGPLTPERIRKFLRHARRGTAAEWARTLAALPAAVRAQVEEATR